jgi:tungstate transport system ATP-binding protein
MRITPTILPLIAEGLGFEARGVTILRDVDLVVRAGPPTVVLGPNGAGKSVLLRLLHGLLAPSAGRIVWAGPEAEARRRQTMVFQRPVMLRRSVLANATYPMRIAGLPRVECRSRALEALRWVGLAEMAGRSARRLSGGEQQRLALARAAALAPELLFLDEPTASLDPSATRAVEAIVADFAARGCKVVMTTHDLGQARRLAGDVAFLHGGRLLEHRPASDFFNSPASPEATAFLRGELLW